MDREDGLTGQAPATVRAPPGRRWAAGLLLGGLLLAAAAWPVLFLAAPAAGPWGTIALLAAGSALAIAGLALYRPRQRDEVDGLEPGRVAPRAALTPSLILAMLLAFVTALAPLPTGYGWVSTFFFVIYLVLALWIAWLLLQAAPPLGFRRAQQAYENGDLDEALRALAALERDDPAYYGIYHLRALVYRHRRQLDAARQACQRLIELRPELYYGHADLGLTLLAGGSPQEAIASLRRAAELAPRLPEGWFNLGMACAEAGEQSAAAEALARALALGLGDGIARLIAHYQLAQTYRALGREQEAEAQWHALRRHRGALRSWRRELQAAGEPQDLLPAGERERTGALLAEIAQAIGRSRG